MPRLPDLESLTKPLLEFAKDEKIHSLLDAEKGLATKFGLTEKQRKITKRSGKEPLFLHRLRWARTYLKKASLITDPKKGYYQITKRGKEVLKESPIRIDTKYLLRFPEFEQWLSRVTEAKNESARNRNKAKKLVKRFGAIVILDALGTKGIWKNNDSEKILELWNNFVNKFKIFTEESLRKIADVSFYSFSDTIIITAKIRKNQLNPLLLKLGSALWPPLVQSMIIGMPLRGCISVGEYYQDARLVIGSSIDEAGKYFELPEWIGISASPSAHKSIEALYKTMPDVVNTVYHKCDIPLKGTMEQNAWVVKWPDIADDFVSDYANAIGKTYGNMREVIEKNIEKTNEIEPSFKWRNTLRFYESVNSKSDETESQ